MGRRGWTLVAGAAIVFVLAAGLAKAPVPYVALAPGRAVNTLGELGGEDVIHVTGTQVAPSDGRLSFTTVSVYEGMDLFTAIRMWFNDDVAVVPREVVYPPGQSQKEADKESEADFVNSQAAAEVVALRELGYHTLVSIAKVQEGSPAIDLLQANDVITSVAGTQVETVSDAVAEIAGHKPGSTVEINYLRGDVPGTAQVPVVAAKDDKKRGSIGVLVEQKQPHDFKISFDIDGIGGPSAGLMFSLGIVDKIDPDDLTGGRNIAGTGTIDEDGKVGPIGGIPQKMLAAKANGAEYFFSPKDNCAEASDTKPAGLRLIKVSTLAEAMTALELIRAGKTPPSC